LRLPIVQEQLVEGFIDYLEALADMRVIRRRSVAALRRIVKRATSPGRLFVLFDKILDSQRPVQEDAKHSHDIRWFSEEARARLLLMKETVRLYTPWLLPEFSSLRTELVSESKGMWDRVPLEQLPRFIDALNLRVDRAAVHANGSGDRSALYQRLKALLPLSKAQAVQLIADLRRLATQASGMAEEMDFHFLLNQRRKLLSAGYDAGTQQLHTACYDLLASESRTSVFVAIAKDDIPQESWFLLGRSHTLDHGRPVLLSWTGTMFEYLMPALWMRSYPNTLLDRSRVAAVQSQQAYTGSRIPWGISESAYYKMDEAGNYQYHAFGVPQLALRQGGLNATVISPYSSFLALHVDAAGSLHNLRRMSSKGWFGPYGFYESADYSASGRRSWHHRYELVRCWMAHHQGMILLSLANFLQDGVVQKWFHSSPRVQATELLLHEKPLGNVHVVRDYSAVA
jgi:hypothetical protein